VGINFVPDAAGAVATGKHTVTVVTDNPTGYNLFISTNTSSNNLVRNGGDANNSNDRLTAINGTIDTPRALTNGTWGFKPTDPDDEIPTTWIGVPIISNRITAIAKTTATPEAPDGDQTAIWYGVKANTTTSAGDYGITVVYVGVMRD
jgi:hypothetical protein